MSQNVPANYEPQVLIRLPDSWERLEFSERANIEAQKALRRVYLHAVSTARTTMAAAKRLESDSASELEAETYEALAEIFNRHLRELVEEGNQQINDCAKNLLTNY